MQSLNPRMGALIAIVLAAAATRLLPHPPNFTSVTALALFGGTYFADRRWAFAVPLLALLLSDLALGLMHSWSIMAVQPHMEVQYLAFALIVALGFRLRQQVTPLRVAGASLQAAVLFFVVTNFGEWLLQGRYPQTFAGLVECYVAAIPFFGNSLAGDAFYTLLLFGGFQLLQQRYASLREPRLLPA